MATEQKEYMRKHAEEYGLKHIHTYTTVTKWDHHASRYTGILDYSEALEVMCSGCLERKSLEETN